MDGIDTSPVTGPRPAASASAGKAAAPVAPAQPAAAKSPAPTADMFRLLADAAPPVDARKVGAIRSLIAQGRYPIDERAIAAKMIALDAPQRG